MELCPPKNRPQARPEEPPQAITGSHHGASATGYRPPRRRTCKAGAFSRGLWQTGRFLGVPGLVGWGARSRLAGKGPEIAEER